MFFMNGPHTSIKENIIRAVILIEYSVPFSDIRKNIRLRKEIIFDLRILYPYLLQKIYELKKTNPSSNLLAIRN